MGQTDPKWYLLGIIALAFLAIQVPRWFDGPAYSEEEGLQICRDAFTKYQSLVAAKASDEEWESFHSEALAQLDAITADHEEHYTTLSNLNPARPLIYQIAKYNLPEVLKDKSGKADKLNRGDIEKQLAQAENVMLAPPTPAKTKKKPRAEPNQGWDPVVVAILIGDLAIVMVGGGFWLWRH